MGHTTVESGWSFEIGDVTICLSVFAGADDGMFTSPESMAIESDGCCVLCSCSAWSGVLFAVGVAEQFLVLMGVEIITFGDDGVRSSIIDVAGEPSCVVALYVGGISVSRVSDYADVNLY